jgi:uncharacterized membrane protein (UPF0127 family)
MFNGLLAVAVLSTLVAGGTPTLPVIVVHAPSADLHLEVAITPAQQERGLMFRTALAPRTGMLFIFNSDAPIAFWMKNTLISLDMIFVAADGTVRRVFRNVPSAPSSMPDAKIPREGGVAKYVIELGAGEAARAGIAPHVRLVIPIAK